MKKYALFVTMAVLLCFTSINLMPVYAVDTEPQISSSVAVLIEANTGEIVYSKDMNTPKEPASTTKIMTCLLALQNLELDQKVIISGEPQKSGGTKMGLVEGEEIAVEELLYALMLMSANDAAVALAEAVSGTVPQFCLLMNTTAKELGAKNTNFVNPNGLHDPQHLSTAYDLAVIGKECVKNKTLVKIATTVHHQVPATNKAKERDIYNTNRLLYDKEEKVIVNGVERIVKYDNTIGLKTGYTSKAGACLVAAAEKEGMEFIAVVLQGSEDGRYTDCIAMLDYGFSEYEDTAIVEKGKAVGTVKVKKGEFNKVEAVAKENLYVPLPQEASSSVIKTQFKAKIVTAPIKKGDVIGTVEIYEGDTIVGTVDAVAANAVGKGTFLSIAGIENKVAYVIYAVVAIIAILLITGFIAITSLKRKQQKRKQQLREKRALAIAKARKEAEEDSQRRNWYF